MRDKPRIEVTHRLSRNGVEVTLRSVDMDVIFEMPTGRTFEHHVRKGETLTVVVDTDLTYSPRTEIADGPVAS